MKRKHLLVFCLLAATATAAANLPKANARSGFAKAFVKKYVGDETTEVQKKLAREIKRVKKCFVCHDSRKDENGKTSKKKRNPYGEALAKLLSKKDQKNMEKALDALSKVENEKAENADKTFGQLLKEGKLPFEYPQTGAK